MMSRVKQSLDKLQNNSNNVEVLILAPWHQTGKCLLREWEEIKQKTQNKGKLHKVTLTFPSRLMMLVSLQTVRPVLESHSSLTSNELNFKWKNNRNPRTPDGVKISTNSNDNLIPSIPSIFLVIDDQVLT